MARNPSFDRNIYLSPIFEGDTVYYETALPFDGEEISLLYPIEEIISVRNYRLDIEYQEGVDYIVRDGKIIILPNSRINTTSLDQYYLKEPASISIVVEPNRCPYKFNEQRYVMYGEGDYMTSRQIAVSYKHKECWNLFRQTNQSDKVNRFINKLISKKETTIVFYGDSITVGCNSSGTEYGGILPPYAEPWPVMVTEYLKEKYNSKINYVNTAVGGTNTPWGVEHFKDNVLKYKPDLLVLGFGMNDGFLPKEEHIKLIMEMVNQMRESNPDCDILLIATTVANIETNWYMAQVTYIEEYQSIGLEHVGIVDMTHMHMDLLKKKRFKDMTGNNVNHPNDFLARVYAQSILEVMGELKCDN